MEVINVRFKEVGSDGNYLTCVLGHSIYDGRTTRS